jgi:hypothetical protein
MAIYLISKNTIHGNKKRSDCDCVGVKNGLKLVGNFAVCEKISDFFLLRSTFPLPTLAVSLWLQMTGLDALKHTLWLSVGSWRDLRSCSIFIGGFFSAISTEIYPAAG